MHRDLRPENILKHDNRYILSNYLFACRFENEVEIEDFCGNPGYLAP